MASLPSQTNNTTNPFKLPQQASTNKGELGSHESYEDFVSTLPMEDRWAPFPHRKYQGFWIAERFLPFVLGHRRDFTPRPTDLLLATCPKSGTTWLKALAFAIVSRSSSINDQHPLCAMSPHECVPFIESPTARDWEALESPRLLATHLPYSLLPESVRDLGCRIVCMSRDPKDVLVSLWHFWNKVMTEGTEPIGLDTAFEIFCEGNSPYGPIWDYNLEYWQESLRWPEKVLFLKYEDVKANPLGSVKKLAEFVGFPFTDQEEKDGVVEKIVELCSFNKLSQVARENTVISRNASPVVLKGSDFYRKGETGDWVNHLSPEMGRKLDDIVAGKLAASGLAFGSSS